MKYLCSKLYEEKGTTLIETLFASIIVSMVLVVVLGVIIFGNGTLRYLSHRIVARNVLTTEMETLRNSLYSGMVSVAPYAVIVDQGEDMIPNTQDDLDGMLGIAVADNSGYKTVSVSLSWEERSFGGSRTVTETVVTNVANVIS
jgi:hypothetical protein